MDSQRPPSRSNAVKRKISWSDDGKEPYGHSKVARPESTVVGLQFATLSRKSTWSDDNDRSDDATDRGESDDDDNATDTNDNDNSGPESPKGLITRSRRERDFPLILRNHQCCQKCEAITGTPEGLGALLSDGGYRHLNWYEIQKTAAQGCALCGAIWHAAEHEDWDRENDGSVTHEEIRIFANVTRLPSFEESGLSGHPLKDVQLHSIYVKMPLESSEIETFNLVTFEGKSKS
jgi:hypothetical protein